MVADPAAARGAFGRATTGASHTVAFRLFALATLVLAIGWIQTSDAKAADSKGVLWSADWSSDEKFFAVGGVWTGIFDAAPLQRRPAPALDSLKDVRKVRWHPRRNWLALSGWADGDTAIYDVANDRKTGLKTKEGTRGIAWNSNGERVATAGNDGELQIWTANGQLLHTTRPENAKSLTGVAWHPTEDMVVTVGEFITLYDSGGKITKRVSHRPKTKGPCLLLCVEWHPSGEFFVVGDYGNLDTGDTPALQFWSPQGDLIKALAVKGSTAIRDVAWNPDGTLLASASDALRIWSRDGQLKHAGKSADLLCGVRWNREGNQLLTSSHEGNVTLWSPTADVYRKVVEAGVSPGCPKRENP